MMTRIATLLFLYSLLISMPSQAKNFASFATEQDIRDWAEHSSVGGHSIKPLTYKQKQLLVVDRHLGSGLNNSRPAVFLKSLKGWVMVFESDSSYPIGFNYQIREGFLEIFSREDSKPIDIRFNLELLP